MQNARQEIPCRPRDKKCIGDARGDLQPSQRDRAFEPARKIFFSERYGRSLGAEYDSEVGKCACFGMSACRSCLREAKRRARRRRRRARRIPFM